MSPYQPKGIKKIFHQTRRYLAIQWLSFFHPIQIAVTGSQGKTNTVQIIAKILSKIGPTVVTDINLDTIYNLPITALSVKPWTKFLVWELGIDRPGEMDLHLQIAKPSVAVITGISPVHTDPEHLGSLKKLISEKRKLIEVLPKEGTAILNYDDKNVREMAKFTKAKVLFYGTDRKNRAVWADNIKVSLKGTTFDLHDQLTSTKLNQPARLVTKLIGLHHIYTLMAAHLVTKTVIPQDQATLDIFKTTVSEITPLRGRMSIEHGPKETLVLNDFLRANPESTRAGLETLSMIDYNAGRKIAVLGVMGELENPQFEHQKTGEQIVKYKPDIVICLGNFRKYSYDVAVKNGFPRDKIYYAKNVFEAAEILKKIVKKDDLIYLKGSFLRNLKRILQILNNDPVCCRADICPYDHCSY